MQYDVYINIWIPLQPTLNLRDLGLSDVKASQLDELVERLLPGYSVENKNPWHTSYISAQSFFENKYGMSLGYLIISFFGDGAERNHLLILNPGEHHTAHGEGWRWEEGTLLQGDAWFLLHLYTHHCGRRLLMLGRASIHVCFTIQICLSCQQSTIPDTCFTLLIFWFIDPPR